jgi:hypothetical protein
MTETKVFDLALQLFWAVWALLAFISEAVGWVGFETAVLSIAMAAVFVGMHNE